MAVLEFLLMLAAVAAGEPSAAQAEPAAPEVKLDPATPARALQCMLGKATNIDLSKDQKPSDIQYAGAYSLKLSLPAAKDADKAKYHVVADPADLFEKSTDFARVADMWPQRVELALPSTVGFNFAVLSDIDPRSRKATIFVGRGKDSASLDPSFVYAGSCVIAWSGGGSERGR
jgi:hypothetical protein